LTVERSILPGRPGPAEVPRHAAALQTAPAIGIAVNSERALDSRNQGACGWFSEQKAGGGSGRERLLGAIDYGIDEATGCVRDRGRAVALTVHLVQPARLESRWHDEEVGTTFDEMRERLVEADHDAHHPGIARCERT